MSEGFGKQFAKKYAKDLKARERGNVANDAGEEFIEGQTTPPVTAEDVARYTLPDIAPSTPEELETEQKKVRGAEWIKKLKETAGLTEVEAEQKQREAFLELVKKDPRTGQKYE